MEAAPFAMRGGCFFLLLLLVHFEQIKLIKFVYLNNMCKKFIFFIKKMIDKNPGAW